MTNQSRNKLATEWESSVTSVPKHILISMRLIVIFLGMASEWFLRIDRINLSRDNTVFLTLKLREFLNDSLTIMQGSYVYVITIILMLVIVLLSVRMNERNNPNIENYTEKIVKTYLFYQVFFLFGARIPGIFYGINPEYNHRNFFDISYPHDIILFLMIAILLLVLIVVIYSYVMDEVLYKKSLFSGMSKSEKFFLIAVAFICTIVMIRIKITS